MRLIRLARIRPRTAGIRNASCCAREAGSNIYPRRKERRLRAKRTRSRKRKRRNQLRIDPSCQDWTSRRTLLRTKAFCLEAELKTMIWMTKSPKMTAEAT